MDQAQVIANVMGYWPPISTTRKLYVKNTLRGDRKPGCWFANKWGYIRLFDYGDLTYNKANYFDLVALKHFHTRTEHNREIIPEVKKIIQNMGQVSFRKIEGDDFRFDLRWEEDDLTQDIIDYYAQYGITEAQLNQDRITGVKYYEYNSAESPGLYSRYYPGDLCVAMPRNGHVKIYRPHHTENSVYKKWVTNCERDDYYYWPRKKDLLLITGSHKDGRCLFNMGYSVWAWQSETNFPSLHSISKFRDYEKIVYFGDIDEGGIRNAQENIGRFQREGIEVIDARMPLGLLRHGIKDVAELVKQQPQFAKQVVDNTLKWNLGA